AAAARKSEQVAAEQTEEAKEPTRKERRAVENAVAAAPQARAPQPPRPHGPERPTPAPPPATERVAPAGPATPRLARELRVDPRRLAREVGVDVRQVSGTGRHGRIVEEDVKTYVRQLASGGVGPVAVGGAPQAPPLPRFEDWGPVERQPLGGVRGATSRQMSL